MLFISIFALTFQPWEPCMSKIMLELIDILNKTVKDKKKAVEWNKLLLNRKRAMIEKRQGVKSKLGFNQSK